MDIRETRFQGLFEVAPLIHGDERGFFMELYNERHFESAGLSLSFKQDNLSRSKKGTLRGLHYQLAPCAQGKLVTVLKGSVFDVVVDLREDSKTCGEWFGVVLDDQKRNALYVPEGFAHGFCVLSEEADFFYKCTQVYSPEHERSLLWSDATVGVEWPLPAEELIISAKDRKAPLWSDLELF